MNEEDSTDSASEECETFEHKAQRVHDMLQKQQRDDFSSNIDEDIMRDEKVDIFSVVNEKSEAKPLSTLPTHVLSADKKADTTGTIENTKRRISAVLHVLANFKSERSLEHQRKEYIDVLVKDVCRLYDYNEFLTRKLLEILPPSEVVEFIEANEKERPVTLRVNTLKSRRREVSHALAQRGVHLQALEKWTNVGLQVFESKVAVGATAEYLAGHYMLQSAVSFLPVITLDPQPNEKVLDLAAAPGGKSSFIVQLMGDSGMLFANDASRARCKSLQANLHRMGCSRVAITSMDGRKYPKMYLNFFDKVLLDAPCTGTGVISRDRSIRASKTQEDLDYATVIQKELLLAAIDCCKVGGTIVYSTCSVLFEENEQVANYALKKRNVQIMESELKFGRPGFDKMRQYRLHSSVTKCRRYFPHLHNMDGFFVCKLLKLEHTSNDSNGLQKTNDNNEHRKRRSIKGEKVLK